MAIASLKNFTVPISASATENAGLLMPKLKYRFRVQFIKFGTTTDTTELTRQIIDVSRPNVSFQNVPIEVYNSKVNYAGKHTWQNITINLRDEATGITSRLVAEQLQKQFDFMEQSSARAAADYKFQTNIIILDGGNGQDVNANLETWECYGCYLQTVNYQNLAYSDSNPVTMTLTIQVDNCLQKPDGSGVGGNFVARALGTAVTGQAQ
jgi:hypothetical protein